MASFSDFVFYTFILACIYWFGRLIRFLARASRCPEPITFRLQSKLTNLTQLNTPDFTLICGSIQGCRYVRPEDWDATDRFLRDTFPGHGVKIPLNLVGVWIPRTNFIAGPGFQQFTPVDGLAANHTFTYQMFADRAQATWYQPSGGRRHLAGICVYPRLLEEPTWIYPEPELKTVVEFMANKPDDYVPSRDVDEEGGETRPLVVNVIENPHPPPAYEELPPQPPRYTALVIESS